MSVRFPAIYVRDVVIIHQNLFIEVMAYYYSKKTQQKTHTHTHTLGVSIFVIHPHINRICLWRYSFSLSLRRKLYSVGIYFLLHCISLLLLSLLTKFKCIRILFLLPSSKDLKLIIFFFCLGCRSILCRMNSNYAENFNTKLSNWL